MEPLRDIYDELAPQRGLELRRRNYERLAALESSASARAARLASLIAPQDAGEPPEQRRAA